MAKEERERREKRFLRLVDATPEDLPDLLRQCVALMVKDNPPLDWGLLALDIRRWESPDRKVQRKWARGFWWNPTTQKQPAEPATN